MSGKYDLVIEKGKGIKESWKELWEYRELFFFLAWKNIIVRYKQTVLGVLWSLIRPFLTMIVFTVIFGSLAKLPSNGVPYPILVFTGLLPWQFFANALSSSSGSIVASAGMISKIYFPRIIIPGTSIIVSFVDFLISFVTLVILMLVYRFIPPWQIILLPGFILLAVITAMGIGLWLTSLNVKYRDFQQLVPFIIQFGIYISPVGFSSSIVPAQWRLLYSMNPVVGVIDGFRWAILGGEFTLYLPGFILSIGIALLFFVTGWAFFKKTERSFADYI